MVEISRVEVGWLGQCSKFGGASRELWHHAHGYGNPLLIRTLRCREVPVSYVFA
jgi:hypothetical protein